MVTKLPFWVLLGGVGLSFIAGYINAIGFLHNHAVTHMTGLVSQVTIEQWNSARKQERLDD